jgi:hypothetical protein
MKNLYLLCVILSGFGISISAGLLGYSLLRILFLFLFWRSDEVVKFPSLHPVVRDFIVPIKNFSLCAAVSLSVLCGSCVLFFELVKVVRYL